MTHAKRIELEGLAVEAAIYSTCNSLPATWGIYLRRLELSLQFHLKGLLG